MGVHCTVIPKPIGIKAYQGLNRLGGYGDAKVDEIKVKVRMKTGVFEQRWLHLLYLNVLLGWILPLNGIVSPTNTVKQRHISPPSGQF